MKKTAAKPARPAPRTTRRADIICVALLLAATLGVYAPALFGGRVLLPADNVLLMRPWSVGAAERYPNFRFAQNQMLGPIFEYYCWRYEARERLRAGQVPLWNPDELSGNVLLANDQSAVLYPPNALLYVLPLWVGINLVTALHTFLTGLFLFGLLRALRLKPAAALTGALVWMFCGLQVAWTEFQTPTATLCWLPGALWAWERFAQTGRLRAGLVGTAAALALTIVAGHLQFAFYVLVAVVMYAVWRTLVQGRAAFARSAWVLAGALVMAGGVSACTMLPVLEMSRSNFRSGRDDYASSIGLRLPPANLLTLLIPDLFGNPRDYVTIDASGAAQPGHPYFGKFDFIEYACYIGVAGLLLALIAVLAVAFGSKPPPEERGPPPLRSTARFFSLLAAVGLLLALGTPLCALFYFGVPGYRQFNAPARAMCLFCFAGAALAGIGVQALCADRAAEGDRRLQRATWIAAIGVVVAVLVAFPGMGLLFPRPVLTDLWLPYETSGLLRALAFAIVTAALVAIALQRASRAGAVSWLLAAVATADVLVAFAGFNPVTDPGMLGWPTQVTDFLRRTSPARVLSLEQVALGIKSLIVPNYNGVVGYREVQGADSLHLEGYDKLMTRVMRATAPQRQPPFPDRNTIRLASPDDPVLDMLDERWVTTVPESPLDPSHFRRTLDAELTVWENPRAFGPAWVVGRAERVAGQDAAFDRLFAPGFDAHKVALVEAQAPALDASAGGSPVRLTRFAPHDLVLDVTSRGRGLLVLSEIAYPGWRAWVDGRATPILRANGILRAVPVPSGESRVTMRYLPASYRVGLYLTCAAIALLCAFWAYGFRRQTPESELASRD